MTEQNDQLRNVSLVGHSGSGKTSISEIMLFKAGVINRVGRIEDGNTLMDFEPEELKRKSSSSSSFCHFLWKEKIINLIDTPGDENFISDTKLCMEASENCILVIDGIDGVKIQTENVWKFSNKFKQSCAIFVNKLDKERSDFSKIIEEIKKDLLIKPIILQIPVIENKTLKGIIDLISKKMYLYDKNKSIISNIPDNMKDEIEIQRENLIESVAEVDDNLIEKYLDGKELSISEINRALKKGISSRNLIPVLLGSGIKDVGIDLLLDFVSTTLLSPIEFLEKEGINLKNNKNIKRRAISTDPFSAFVFKTITDPYAGRLSLLKIVSGHLKNDGTFYNSIRDSKERFNQLLAIIGKEQNIIKLAGPGSIVAIPKLKVTKTGDTLCDESEKIIYTCAKPIQTSISFAIEAKNKGDEDKVYISLSKLLDDDPSLKLDRNSETKEILISGLGQIHIETTSEKLKRKYNVEILLKTPKIPYRETIKKKVRVQGKHKKQSGGHGQFGDCWITIEPLPRGSGFEFVDSIVGGAIPKQYVPAVEKGIIEAAQKGILTGFPFVDFKATCDYGSYHAVDSSEMAFKIAGSIAFKKGCEEAKTVILEPIMKVIITTPEKFTGDVMGDLNSRRGRVLGIESVNKDQSITAEVPLAEIQTYAPNLRSITAGRGLYKMFFSRYDEVPFNLYAKVLEKIKKYNSQIK